MTYLPQSANISDLNKEVSGIINDPNISIYSNRSGIIKRRILNFSVTRELLPQPKEFILFLTYKCNLSCDMCTQYGGKFKKYNSNELTIDEWESFIEDVSIIKPEITLIGGEPLLYKDIDKLLYILASNGCHTKLVTNGYYLKDHIKHIMDTDTDLIISIDGTSKTHNVIRHSEDSFEKIIESLELIDILKKKYPSFKILTNSVLLPDNIEDIHNLLQCIMKYNPSKITFQHPQYSSQKLNELTNSHWNKYLNAVYKTKLLTKKYYLYDKLYVNIVKSIIKLIKNNDQHSNRINIFPDLQEDELDLYYSEEGHLSLFSDCICTKPWFKPYIDPSGDLLICMEKSIGNIKKDNFWDIWNNADAQKFRSSLLKNGRFPICTRCCEFFMDPIKIIHKNLYIKRDDCNFLKDKICISPHEMLDLR